MLGGNITCAQTGQTITGNAVYIGGIAGSQGDTGSIKDTNFTGNITVSDGNTYGGITATGKYFYIGGIVGYADDGVISGCDVATSLAPKAFDIRGKFVLALGGVAGWYKTTASSEIRNCNNYSSLTFASDAARADNSPIRVAGIAARSAAPIIDCQNYGAIASTCNATTMYLGGIVGDGINVSGCTNNSSGTITRTGQTTAGQSNRYIYMGGIMGANNAAADVTNCTNNATVLSNTYGTATGTTVDMGGIVGYGQAQIDISSCINNGAVTNTGSNGAVIARITAGGVLGYGPIANTTIKSCSNTAQVYCNTQTQANGRPTFTGGIAGMMGTVAGGVADLEIDNCSNSVRVWSRNYNNTVGDKSKAAFGGGIVGFISGTDVSRAYVHDCTTTANDVVGLRGYAGGIAGYAEYATIKDNTVGQLITANANSHYNGGIVAWSVGSDLSGCTLTGTVNLAKNIGGIVCVMDGASTITDCNLNGATLTKGTHPEDATEAAVLVSNAASGATITNCGVKGTLNSAAITLGSNMITTDAGATVSGTYLIP